MESKVYAVQLIDFLKKNHKTISTAESLTGGLVSKLITDIPGVSEVFKGGICSYTNEIKHAVLDVNSKILEEFGAVSEETASSMSSHVRKLMNTDIGISTTGVAGPGKSEGHDVGLVYISVSTDEETTTKRIELPHILSREEIRNITAKEVINLCISVLNFK